MPARPPPRRAVPAAPNTWTRPQQWAGLAAAWVTLWGLLTWIGIQDHVRGGGTEPWRPAVHESTSMVVATVWLAVQWWHARRLDPWLDRPLHWFARALAWLPVAGPLFVVAVFSLRALVFGWAGQPYAHDPWLEAMRYELPKFAIYFGLFAGVQFGARSSNAWHQERLRAEQLRRLTEQAQLAQLTHQLQPHFLFNALNTVSALIHDDPDRADAVLGRLAGLLRAATDATQRIQQPLRQEVALARDYMDIMQARFGDRVQVRWQIEGVALACEVPTLCLQVLLENVVKHVVERRRAVTTISVTAHCGPPGLQLAVHDDGTLGAPVAFGVGLGNLQQRLVALHGAAARLTLTTEHGATCARMTLPCAC